MPAPNVVTQLPAYRAGQRASQGLFSIGGHIDAPANQDYVLLIYVPTQVIIQFGTFKLSSGTLTANAKIGANTGALTSITGMSAVAVTSTLQTILFSATDGTNVAPVSYVVAITVSAGAAPLNFDFSLAALMS